MDIDTIVNTLLFRNGFINGFISYIGLLRLFIKPLMSLFLHITQLTETKKDDELYNKVERSWWYNSIVFVLDWMTSLKIKR